MILLVNYKQKINLTVDAVIWEAFQLQFPRQASQIFEQQMQRMLGMSIDKELCENKRRIEEELYKLQEIQKDSSAKEQLLSLKLQEISKKEKENIEQELSHKKNDYFFLPEKEKVIINQKRDEAISTGEIDNTVTVVEYYAKHWGGIHESS